MASADDLQAVERADAPPSDEARAALGAAAASRVSPTAERMRAHRVRQAQGRAVLLLDVNLVDTEEMLIASGYLTEWQRDDRKAVEAAAGKLWSQLASGGDA